MVELNTAFQDDQVVAFKLGKEEYAVNITSVQEIIRWTHVTRVPRTPSYIKGIINLRGIVIPIIDSHSRFNLPIQEVNESTRIIVFKIDDNPIGLTVDSITEVIRISAQNIETPNFVQGSENSYIKGIGKYEGGLLIILDVDKVLDFNMIFSAGKELA